MYIVGLILAFIILIAVVQAYPYDTNPSRVDPRDNPPNHDRPLDGDDGKVKKEDYKLPTCCQGLPPNTPATDITQPLLNPTLPLQKENPLPRIPKWSNDPRVILEHPTLLIEDPPRSHLATLIPHTDFKEGKYGSPSGKELGETIVNVTLPGSRDLCWKYGEVRPPTFHVKGHASLNGTNLIQAAIDPQGDVIPHVFITSWNQNTGEVTLRNDYTNWHGDVTLGYYLLCNYPTDFEDTREVVKQMTYNVSI